MSNSREVLEKAVERAKKADIKIDYRNMGDGFFYLQISSPTGDGGNRSYVFSHIPYSDVKNLSEEALLERIKQIASHSIWG
jgi:hypothetical protein